MRELFSRFVDEVVSRSLAVGGSEARLVAERANELRPALHAIAAGFDDVDPADLPIRAAAGKILAAIARQPREVRTRAAAMALLLALEPGVVDEMLAKARAAGKTR